MKGLVTKVLRVFVDAYPHVPEHRRLPVFVHLLTTLGPSSYLHVCLALLLEKLSSKDAKVIANITFNLICLSTNACMSLAGVCKFFTNTVKQRCMLFLFNPVAITELW